VTREPDDDGAIREVFEEHDRSDGQLAKILDPENERAWIQSDVTREVVQ